MSKKPYKIKRGHKGLIIFLVIFGILVVLPVGFIFGAFFVTKTKDVSNKTVKYENLVSQVFYKGLADINPSNPELKFTINEEMIDGIMIAACEKINQPNYIPKMYCYINDNNYTFVVDLQASFFKSRAMIHTSLDKEESTLVFKITGVTLGRLPIPLNWVTSILGGFLNDETLNNAFSESGFHIQSHLVDAKLTYSREQFKIDVGAYLSKLGDNNPFLDVLLSTIDDNRVLTTNYKNGVSVGLNLSELMLKDGKDKPDYYKQAPLKFVDLDNHKTEVAHLLNSGLKEKDAPKVFKYLIRGKDAFDELEGLEETHIDEIKYYIDKDGAIELNAYEGSKITKIIVEEEPKEIEIFAKYCKDSLTQGDVISYTTENSSITFKLPSDKLNRVLASKKLDIIGKTIPITFKDDDQWYFEYIVIDNVYTGFTPEKEGQDAEFNIFLQLNIGGSPVTLTITTNDINFEVAESNDDTALGHIKFKLKTINFGSIEIKDEELINSVVHLIPTKNDLFKYNEQNEQFEISIDNLIGETITDEIKNIVKTIFSRGAFKTEISLSEDEPDTLNLTYSVNN